MKCALFNRFEIAMPDDAIEECHHQGACDADVAAWSPRIKINATPDQIRDELREYGCWEDADLTDDAVNKERIIWLAAGDIQDAEFEKESQ